MSSLPGILILAATSSVRATECSRWLEGNALFAVADIVLEGVITDAGPPLEVSATRYLKGSGPDRVTLYGTSTLQGGQRPAWYTAGERVLAYAQYHKGRLLLPECATGLVRLEESTTALTGSESLKGPGGSQSIPALISILLLGGLAVGKILRHRGLGGR